MTVTAAGVANQCYLCGGECDVEVLGGLAYFRCRSCGLVIRQERRVETGFIEETYGPEYYADPESYPSWDAAPHLQDLLQQRAARLAGLKPAGGSLLDIGCGLGDFLRVARESGWAVVGVEPASYARKVASERAQAPVHQDLEDVERLGARFEAVTLWDVLEHDADPINILARIHRLTSPGAVLGVSMPNMGGLEARLRGRSWRYFRPKFGHMTHHTKKTLTLLLGHGGFDVAAIETDGSLNLEDRLNGLLPALPAATVQRAADRAIGAVGLGRNMTAYAIRR